jgi:radical SAM superfamily enzyme YgiQ (UPF0313 family)
MKMKLHCLLVSLPFSVSINSPLLGLGILRSYAEKKHLNVKILDLNYEYIEKHHTGSGNTNSNQFFDSYIDSLLLPKLEKGRIPSCTSEFSAFPYNFSEIDSILTDLAGNNFWGEFINEKIFEIHEDIPVVGITVMGPNQVLLALLLAKLIKQKWSGTTVIAGGTHITLLKDRISQNKSYFKYIDDFFYGHCEDQFADFLYSRIFYDKSSTEDYSSLDKLKENTYSNSCYDKRLPPSFSSEYINLYDKSKIVFPVQLHRGCYYGKCNFCTYSAVEKNDIEKNYPMLAEKYIADLIKWDPDRISLRDSSISFANALKVGKIIKEKTSAVWRFSAITKQKITPETAKELYFLNCRVIELGVETIHKHTQCIANKKQDLDNIEFLINNFVSNNIKVQLNLIFGFPNETLQDAEKQLDWYFDIIDQHPDHVFGMLNMLEVCEKSNFQRKPEQYGIKLKPISPWSSNCVWDAPAWRENFNKKIINAKNNAYIPEVSEKLLFL